MPASPVTNTPSEPRTITLSGQNNLGLATSLWGEDNVDPVVLLHGGGQTRQAWGGTGTALAAAGWRVYAVDMRGHGDSEWPVNPDYDFEFFGQDVIEICEQLDRAPIVVGASLGGISALSAQGMSKKQLYRGLVLVDITPRMEVEGVQRIVGFMTSSPNGFASLEEAAEAIAGYRLNQKRTKNLDGLKKVLRQKEDGRWHWHWDIRFITHRMDEAQRPPAETINRMEEGEQHFDGMRERLLRCAGKVEVPALLMRGKLTDLVSEEGAQELLKAMPNASYVDVHDATHMLAGDQNDIFTEEVLRFASQI